MFQMFDDDSKKKDLERKSTKASRRKGYQTNTRVLSKSRKSIKKADEGSANKAGSGDD